MRRNSDGVADGVFDAGSSAAKGRARRASHMLRRNSFGSRQHAPKHPAQQPLGQRPAVVPFDPDAGLIDQVHVVHPRRTGRHAGQARQAAVDMLDHVLRRRPVLLQHLLDQVDAAARAIELVAEQHIGRTGRGAEAAMHAGAQDLVGFRDVGIGQLRQREFGLHAAAPARSPAAVEDVLWDRSCCGPARASARKPVGLRLEHVDLAPHGFGLRAARWRDRPTASTR